MLIKIYEKFSLVTDGKKYEKIQTNEFISRTIS